MTLANKAWVKLLMRENTDDALPSVLGQPMESIAEVTASYPALLRLHLDDVALLPTEVQKTERLNYPKFGFDSDITVDGDGQGGDCLGPSRIGHWPRFRRVPRTSFYAIHPPTLQVTQSSTSLANADYSD